MKMDAKNITTCDSGVTSGQVFLTLGNGEGTWRRKACGPGRRKMEDRCKILVRHGFVGVDCLPNANTNLRLRCSSFCWRLGQLRKTTLHIQNEVEDKRWKMEDGWKVVILFMCAGGSVAKTAGD